MDHFIRYYDESLDKETCRQIISRFDADPRQISGRVSGNAGPELDRAAKQTNELILPDDAVWSDLKRALQQSMSVGLGKYQAGRQVPRRPDHKSLYAEPLRVKKYDIGGQFSSAHRLQLGAESFAVAWPSNGTSTMCPRAARPSSRTKRPRLPVAKAASPSSRCRGPIAIARAAAQRAEICLHDVHTSTLLGQVDGRRRSQAVGSPSYTA